MPIVGPSRTRGLHFPQHPRVLRPDHPLARGLVGAFFPGPSPLHWVDLTGRRLGTPDNSSGDLTARAQNDFDALTTMFSGDGTNDRIMLGSVAATDPLALAGQTELTVLAWVHRTADSGTFSRIIDKSYNAYATYGWSYYLDSTNYAPRFRIDGGSSSQWHEAGVLNTVPLNQTVLIGYSMHSLSDGRFFQDGTLVGSSTQTQKPIPGVVATNAAVGNWNHAAGRWNHAAGRMWEGEILGVMVYDRALSAAEHAEAFDPASRWGFMQEPSHYWFLPAVPSGGAVAIAGTMAAVSAVSGAASAARSVAGDLAAASTATASAGVARAASATMAAASDIAGALARSRAVSATLTAASTVTGAVARSAGVSATMAALSTATGALGRSRAIASTMAAVSTLSGALSTFAGTAIAGTMAGVSAMSGALSRATSMAGQSASSSTVSGAIIRAAGVAGDMASTVSAVGALGVRRAVAVVMAGVSALSAALSVSRPSSTQPYIAIRSLVSHNRAAIIARIFREPS